MRFNIGSAVSGDFMKLLSLFLNFTLISVALAQQPQAQQPQAQPPAVPSSPEQAVKPAILEGRILNAKTGEPVKKANITLRPSGGVSGAGGGGISSAGSFSAMGPPAAPYA